MSYLSNCFTRGDTRGNELLKLNGSKYVDADGAGNQQHEVEKIHLEKGSFSRMQLIGRGYFAKVYLGVNDESLVQVALKFTDHYSREELFALQELSPHPNIVSLLDHKMDGSKATFALELADFSVDRMIGLYGQHQISLSQPQLNFFLSEILTAYLHIEGLYLLSCVDLNSRNVVYSSKDQHLKLCDFGTYRQGTCALRDVGKLMHYVLFRTSHNCTATEPDRSTNTYCSDACLKGITDEKPSIDNMNWQKNCDEKFSRLVVDFYNRESSLNLSELAEKLAIKSHHLPRLVRDYSNK